MAIRDVDLDARPTHERALVDRFSTTRDPDAFSDLVTSTRPWLVSTCTRMLGGDRYMAEDVAQDCYVKAFGFLANGGAPMDVRSWLFAVARNACIDEIRKTRAVPVDEVPERAIAEDDLELDAPLETAWTALKPRQRNLIFMREFMGMSYREIADHTETSLPAVETVLFRARSSLRRQYRRAGGTVPGLAWLGLGLRGVFRGGRSRTISGPARWAASAQDRINAVLARFPSSPSDLTAGAAGFTVAVVLAAGVIGGGPGRAPEGPGAPHGTARATVAAVAAVSNSNAARLASRPQRDQGRAGTASRSTEPGGETTGQTLPSGGVGRQSVQQIGSDTVTAAGQVVQGAADTVKKTADTVKKTADDVTNTVSNTVGGVASGTGSNLPGLPGH